VSRLLACLLLAPLALTLSASTAFAKHWDLIYADQVNAALCEGCGLTPATDNAGILANTGTQPLTVAEMDVAQLTSQSSVPGLSLTPILNDYGVLFSDLSPGHARGNGGRALLTDLLHPGELMEDPNAQFFVYQIQREFGTYEGPVTFHCTLELAGESVEFDVLVHVSLGPVAYDYLHASRTGSTPLPTAARRHSWGRIKTIHR
jgi:hypothetical protein